MKSMFDTLLRLPLFQGLTHDELTDILFKVQLHFAKHPAGSVVVEAGEVCDRLLFVLRGTVAVVTKSTTVPCRLTEYFDAPYVVEPVALFGRDTHYRSTCRAETEVHTVAIDKAQVLGELLKREICMLGFTNIACHRAQVLGEKLWSPPSGDAGARIRGFMLHAVDRPMGHKVFKVKMEDLASIVGESRISVSQALNAMQGQGLVRLRRGEVDVPDMAKMRP